MRLHIIGGLPSNNSKGSAKTVNMAKDVREGADHIIILQEGIFISLSGAQNEHMIDLNSADGELCLEDIRQERDWKTN